MRSISLLTFLSLALLPLAPAAAADEGASLLCDTYVAADVHRATVAYTRVTGPGGAGLTLATQPQAESVGARAMGMQTTVGEVVTLAAAGYGGLSWRAVAADGPMAGHVIAAGTLDPDPTAEPLASFETPASRVCVELAVPTGGTTSAAYAVAAAHVELPAISVDPEVPPAPSTAACITVRGENGDTRVCTPDFVR